MYPMDVDVVQMRDLMIVSPRDRTPAKDGGGEWPTFANTSDIDLALAEALADDDAAAAAAAAAAAPSLHPGPARLRDASADPVPAEPAPGVDLTADDALLAPSPRSAPASVQPRGATPSPAPQAGPHAPTADGPLRAQAPVQLPAPVSPAPHRESHAYAQPGNGPQRSEAPATPAPAPPGREAVHVTGPLGVNVTVRREDGRGLQGHAKKTEVPSQEDVHALRHVQRAEEHVEAPRAHAVEAAAAAEPPAPADTSFRSVRHRRTLSPDSISLTDLLNRSEAEAPEPYRPPACAPPASPAPAHADASTRPTDLTVSPSSLAASPEAGRVKPEAQKPAAAPAAQAAVVEPEPDLSLSDNSRIDGESFPAEGDESGFISSAALAAIHSMPCPVTPGHPVEAAGAAPAGLSPAQEFTAALATELVGMGASPPAAGRARAPTDSRSPESATPPGTPGLLRQLAQAPQGKLRSVSPATPARGAGVLHDEAQAPVHVAAAAPPRAAEEGDSLETSPFDGAPGTPSPRPSEASPKQGLLSQLSPLTATPGDGSHALRHAGGGEVPPPEVHPAQPPPSPRPHAASPAPSCASAPAPPPSPPACHHSASPQSCASNTTPPGAKGLLSRVAASQRSQSPSEAAGGRSLAARPPPSPKAAAGQGVAGARSASPAEVLGALNAMAAAQPVCVVQEDDSREEYSNASSSSSSSGATMEAAVAEGAADAPRTRWHLGPGMPTPPARAASSAGTAHSPGIPLGSPEPGGRAAAASVSPGCPLPPQQQPPPAVAAEAPASTSPQQPLLGGRGGGRAPGGVSRTPSPPAAEPAPRGASASSSDDPSVICHTRDCHSPGLSPVLAVPEYEHTPGRVDEEIFSEACAESGDGDESDSDAGRLESSDDGGDAAAAVAPGPSGTVDSLSVHSMSVDKNAEATPGGTPGKDEEEEATGGGADAERETAVDMNPSHEPSVAFVAKAEPAPPVTHAAGPEREGDDDDDDDTPCNSRSPPAVTCPALPCLDGWGALPRAAARPVVISVTGGLRVKPSVEWSMLHCPPPPSPSAHSNITVVSRTPGGQPSSHSPEGRGTAAAGEPPRPEPPTPVPPPPAAQHPPARCTLPTYTGARGARAPVAVITTRGLPSRRPPEGGAVDRDPVPFPVPGAAAEAAPAPATPPAAGIAQGLRQVKVISERPGVEDRVPTTPPNPDAQDDPVGAAAPSDPFVASPALGAALAARKRQLDEQLLREATVYLRSQSFLMDKKQRLKIVKSGYRKPDGPSNVRVVMERESFLVVKHKKRIRSSRLLHCIPTLFTHAPQTLVKSEAADLFLWDVRLTADDTPQAAWVCIQMESAEAAAAAAQKLVAALDAVVAKRELQLKQTLLEAHLEEQQRRAEQPLEPAPAEASHTH
eukprot:TRINITY_DN5302_c0_g1_i1.p1 TRINITY_DN5302_c0_g1~~TRINITY_DN5302_c0_g1_i1.p1  ORF type:complete len:1465 (+),score=470.57 TRINITY_DN5302_c0_g1_i1:226-4395(+)